MFYSALMYCLFIINLEVCVVDFWFFKIHFSFIRFKKSKMEFNGNNHRRVISSFY